MSIDPIKGSHYCSLSPKYLKGLKPKEYPLVAELIVQIYNDFFLKKIERVELPKNLKKQIYFHQLCFSEIQRGLDRGATLTTLAMGKYLGRSLQEQRTYFSLTNPEQFIKQKIILSYSILPFPYQQTCLRNTLDYNSVIFWANQQVEGAKFLFKYLDQDQDLPHLQLDKPQIYLVHRLLFFHTALFEEGESISWLQLLSDWVQNRGERKARVTKLLEACKHIFSHTLPLPPAGIQVERRSRFISI